MPIFFVSCGSTFVKYYAFCLVIIFSKYENMQDSDVKMKDAPSATATAKETATKSDKKAVIYSSESF